MIVWVASFPRSGNTYLRILLHRMYGVRTGTVYEVDNVAARVGEDLVGWTGLPGTIDELRSSADVHVVKTHSARRRPILEDDPAICVVRDGRDALVSWARLRAEERGTDFGSELRTVITQPRDRGQPHWDSGSWGTNVLSWVQPSAGHRVVVRYDDLVSDPQDVVRAAVERVAPTLEPRSPSDLPTFAELHAADPGFFRRGTTGSHADELPADLQEAFWAREDNARGMAWLREAEGRRAGN